MSRKTLKQYKLNLNQQRKQSAKIQRKLRRCTGAFTELSDSPTAHRSSGTNYNSKGEC